MKSWKRLQSSGRICSFQVRQLVMQGLFEHCRAQCTASTICLEPTGKLGLCKCQELVYLHNIHIHRLIVFLHIDTVALSKAGSKLMHSAATATLPPCKAPQMRSKPQPFGCNNCARTPCRVVAPDLSFYTCFQDLNQARSVFQELV